MADTNVLTASEGHVLTNGTAYGTEIHLGATDSAANWWEVTEAEYQEFLESESFTTDYSDESDEVNAEALGKVEEALRRIS